MTTFSGIAQLAVVVRDMRTSVDWYRRVLGFEPMSEVEPGPPDAGHPRLVVRHADSGLVLGVHEPTVRGDDMFDPARTGLDHVAVAVADRAALGTWSRRLDEPDVAHSPVRDAGYAEFVSVFDPDGAQWELWAVTPGS